MKLKGLIEELMLDQEKVQRLKTKHLTANQQITEAISLQGEAQRLLDKATSKVHRKIKTFQTIDLILAEFKFAVKQKEEAQQKAIKRQKTKTPKTAEQTMADVMACLENLPEDQQKAVLATMQVQQN